MTNHLLILGASVRAAAFSALRAGLRPWCVDLFADLDLRAKCPAVAVDPSRYPNGFIVSAREAPPGPWMYTGGLENRPRLIRRLMRERTLWGNDDVALAKARDPFALHRALIEAGVPSLDVRRPGRQPRDGRWLVKPIAGSGGAGIRFADGRPPSPRHYLQAFREGESRSAVFVATDEDTRLVGVTRQFVGESWVHAPPFRYCGSIGPLEVGESERSAWQRLGRTVATFARLRGIFGIDAIVDDGVPWPVEINPRYTASVEVLEYAGRMSHALLWQPWFRQTIAEPSPRGSSVVGKAVYYAERPLVVPQGPWSDVIGAELPVTELPPFADIPAVGQSVPAGTPVLTFFARAATPTECLARMRATAADVDRRLVDYL
jgi:predicted ATP-grasp superfamily ATP-dependent carboligase